MHLPTPLRIMLVFHALTSVMGYEGGLYERKNDLDLRNPHRGKNLQTDSRDQSYLAQAITSRALEHLEARVVYTRLAAARHRHRFQTAAHIAATFAPGRIQRAQNRRRMGNAATAAAAVADRRFNLPRYGHNQSPPPPPHYRPSKPRT
ncbi:hypothetical protein FA15DRAFT_758763 [Coprinopsis marcescibilis]|uniref:Secreted protein n=1 Tax=Coprinopsis marcescibilis TaxID=230819 RepID=A0A5C3KMX7_COPMA|nr:hypothetical protein FA15DRAFT_758763 [Coprinopsis marcescibilis]